MSGVMRSAVKNRLIGIDPTLGVRVPGRRVRDTDERIATREDVRQRLVPVVQPTRYRTLVATAAFTGLRWGEAVGLCRDAVDLDGRIVRVIRLFRF
jgi:integrase